MRLVETWKLNLVEMLQMEIETIFAQNAHAEWDKTILVFVNGVTERVWKSLQIKHETTKYNGIQYNNGIILIDKSFTRNWNPCTCRKRV